MENRQQIGSTAYLNSSTLTKKPSVADVQTGTKMPKNNFIKQTPVKTEEGHTFELGLEFNPELKNDNDYFDKIFANNNYTPSSENLIDHYLEVKRMMEMYNYRDRGNVGAVIGVAVIGLFGFLAFSWTIVGGLAGGVLGGALGRAAGKKFISRRKQKHPMDQEELFMTKIQCVVKLGQIQQHFLKNNLNKYRIAVEKLIEESALAFDFSLFQDQERVKKIVREFREFIITPQSQKAILLSYKLFKRHFKRIDLEDGDALRSVAHQLHNVYIPYTKLIQISENTDDKTIKKLTNLITYKKIKKFIMRPEIIAILHKYPDQRDSPEFMRFAKSFFKQKVDTGAVLDEETERIMPKSQEIISAPNSPDNGAGIIKTLARVSALENRNNISGELNSFEVDERSSKKGFPYIDLINGFRTPSPRDKREYAPSGFGPHRRAASGCMPGKGSILSGTVGSPSRMSDIADLKIDLEALSRGEHKRGTSQNAKKAGEHSAMYDENSLYDQSPELKSSLEKNTVNIRHKLEKEIFEGRLNINILEEFSSLAQQQIQKDQSFHEKMSKTGSIKKVETLSMNQLDIQVDSQHAVQKPDIIKGNSFDKKKEQEGQEKDSEDDQEEQRRKDLIEQRAKGKERMSSVRFSTIIANQIQNKTKTKKELNFERIMSIAYDEKSKWEKVVSNSVITIHKIKPEDSPVVLLRAWACLEGVTPTEVFNQIYDTTERAKWDSVLSDLQVVEKLDSETEVIYFYIKTPFGVTERDFVQQRQIEFDYPEKGQIIMSFQSCSHPAKPVMKSRIRGETTLAGYIIKPSEKVPNSTDFCILSQVDIKGSIPKVVVNMVSGKAPADWIHKLKKACAAAKK